MFSLKNVEKALVFIVCSIQHVEKARVLLFSLKNVEKAVVLLCFRSKMLKNPLVLL